MLMRAKREDDSVSASELAQMAYCERQVAFDAAFGRRTTGEQRAAQGRGLRAHEEFYRESRRIAEGSARKGQCFVATMALGDCEETRELRAFRDLYLRRSAMGRQFIHAYYRLSPVLCRWMQGKPALVRACRAPLRVLAGLATLFVNKALER
ncbi:MAG: hypothetical protein DI603_22560 [Roseateles depolymerans]|uniref:Uncharacterized protein n=1 Tax=Roseateles depolymerans TaxID=76731 RepID=A0A2W5DA11_9BURK|nr:MAG: hypothetical protein DI603_22560 [Roseateles depolymerans]